MFIVNVTVRTKQWNLENNLHASFFGLEVYLPQFAGAPETGQLPQSFQELHI